MSLCYIQWTLCLPRLVCFTWACDHAVDSGDQNGHLTAGILLSCAS